MRRATSIPRWVTSAEHSCPTYHTKPNSASEGEDYTAVEGQLQWPDGDTKDQRIVVPIGAVDSAPELPEQFEVVLTDPQGGASLGSRAAVVEIAPNGDPAGMLGLEGAGSTVTVDEGNAVTLFVRRDYYALGAVSVTLTSTAGTATAHDFDADPVTISWPDGDVEPRAVTLAIEDDRDDEPNESFTVTLAQPAGGAVVGPLSSVSITISDNDSSGGGGGSSGGGRFGLLSLLLLGAAGLRRWAWREHDRRCDDVRRRLRPELRRYAEAGRR